MPHFQTSCGALFPLYNVNKHISSKDPSKVLWFVLCTKSTWPGEEHLHQSGVLHEDSSPITDLWVRNYYLLKVVDTSNQLFSTNYSTIKIYAMYSAESLDVWGYLSYIEWKPTCVWSYYTRQNQELLWGTNKDQNAIITLRTQQWHTYL